MQIFVKTLTNKTVVMDVSPSHTVQHVKAVLQDREGVPETHMRLVCGGKELPVVLLFPGRGTADTSTRASCNSGSEPPAVPVASLSTLADCGVRAHSTLQMLLRLHGGASHKPWVPTYSDAEKTYVRRDFANAFKGDVSYCGEVRRHKYDMELACAAAAYTKGPRYSDATSARIADVLRSRDNVHYHGSKVANTRDRYAADAVLRSRFTGDTVAVGAHHASHIRKGAEFIASRKDDLPDGFVKSVARMYVGVVDGDGHKVVDGRMFNTGRPRTGRK